MTINKKAISASIENEKWFLKKIDEFRKKGDLEAVAEYTADYELCEAGYALAHKLNKVIKQG